VSRRYHGIWRKAIKALGTARKLIEDDPDASASRAYYAAFYGVLAYFAREGKSFRKHSGVREAVSRDLAHTGKIPIEIGRKYSALMDLRHLSDYAETEVVTDEEAAEAVKAAEDILGAIHQLAPNDLPLAEDQHE
jgi:uncharacterized protein (UPF0332 family)